MVAKAASDRRNLLSTNESTTITTLPSHPRRRTNAVPSNGFPGGYIHELPEHVLHPLVDSTNPRLNSVCIPRKSLKGAEADAAIIPPWAVQSCEKVRAKKYFSPSKFTVAVHMWTHTFLGWSFFRGLFNSGVYAQVERELIPTMQCPVQLYVWETVQRILTHAQIVPFWSLNRAETLAPFRIAYISYLVPN